MRYIYLQTGEFLLKVFKDLVLKMMTLIAKRLNQREKNNQINLTPCYIHEQI